MRNNWSTSGCNNENQLRDIPSGRPQLLGSADHQSIDLLVAANFEVWHFRHSF